MGLFDITFKRRCIAVDVGQSRIKAILAERKGKRLDVLHAFTLDLQDEGLLTPEETNHHISRILREMGDYPVALAIPQHVAVSHLVALPSGVKSSRSRMIETETQNLTGLSEGAIVYDYFRLKSEKGSRNTVWVTVSGEQELAEHIRRLQTSGLAVKEVTNAGNALASTFLATHSSPHQRVALVDIGATSTTVVVLERMQPAFAGTLPYGGEFFTQAIADNLHLPFDEAETIKKTEPVFEGKDCPEFAEAVGRWQQEIEKLLGEYLKEGEGGAPALEVLLAGGGSFQAGLVDFLQESSSLRYRLWRGDPCGVDLQTYGVAYGAALAGHRNAPVRCSLLPKPVRQERFRALQVKLFNAAAAVLMAVILFCS